MDDTAALALLEKLAPHLDPWSLNDEAEQWLKCRTADVRADWFERAELTLRWWTDPAWRESMYAPSPARSKPAPPR